MAGFDDLIRGALEKQGNPTAERRAAIYQSSRQALERMLEQNTSLDEAAIKAQRVRLEQAINNVEQDYAQAAPVAEAPTQAVVTPTPPPVQSQATPQPPSPPPVASKPSPAPAPMPKAAAPVAPVQPTAVPQPTPAAPIPQATTASPRPVEAPLHLEPEISVDADAAPVSDYPDNYRGNAFEDRKPYAKLLLWTIILVGLAVAAWWAITFGPAFLKQQFDGSVPNPSTTIESGSFVPNEGNGWIAAFDPNEDAHNIVSTNRGTADLMRNGENQFVRIASNSGSTQNNLRIKIPRGVMESIKGRSATFELMIKNSATTEHQFAVFCEFSAMGNCGRKRFKANDKVEAFIFDALINDVDLPNGQDAYLDLNTDLSNNGKSIDLYSVRVRAG